MNYDGSRATTPVTILLVDDEESVRKLASRMIERLGHKTLLAADGQEGVDVFHRERGKISLILLDLTMPKLTGKEVLERVRATDQEIPIILSSGYPADEDMSFFHKHNVSAFLPKPYTFQELTAALHRALAPA